MHCNHIYAQKLGNRDFGSSCPYPEFYKRIYSSAPASSEAGLDATLPSDRHGACVFHSQDVPWKRQNSFQARFVRLVHLLNADDSSKAYNFCEFVFVGPEPTGLAATAGFEMDGIAFLKQAYFRGGQFQDAVSLKNVQFKDGADFRSAMLACDLSIANTGFKGIEFSEARVQEAALFTSARFESYACFRDAVFNGSVRFEDSTFAGITDFCGTEFKPRNEQLGVLFSNVRFDSSTDFRSTTFRCHVEFRDAHFASNIDFTDTAFEPVRSARRYRGAAVEFNRIRVDKDAVVNFLGTVPINKLFKHDVQFSFEPDPEGTLRFENVNYCNISEASRVRLAELARTGRVVVGAGCIKYRCQTETRTVSIDESNANLVTELCQTFTNYFTMSNGYNLGFEIVDRGETRISFFYFTDEDISASAFYARLAETEQSLWRLLSISPVDYDSLEVGSDVRSTALKENSIINTVDGLSALLGTFWRVGVRIALRKWSEADTNELLGAIRFNRGNESVAKSIHGNLVGKYQASNLFLINRRQNELLRLDPDLLRLRPLSPDSATEGAHMSKRHLFLSYVREDGREVAKLGEDLIAAGERVWWDQRDILAGQDYKLEISRAIKQSYAILACFSAQTEARHQSGMFAELREAIDAYRQFAPGTVYLIPVRLSESTIPDFPIDSVRNLGSLQYVDLFPDWHSGVRKVIEALKVVPHRP